MNFCNHLEMACAADGLRRAHVRVGHVRQMSQSAGADQAKYSKSGEAPETNACTSSALRRACWRSLTKPGDEGTCSPHPIQYPLWLVVEELPADLRPPPVRSFVKCGLAYWSVLARPWPSAAKIRAMADAYPSRAGPRTHENAEDALVR